MGRKVKKKVKPGLIILLVLAVLVFGGLIAYLIVDNNYKNRPDTHEYYLKNQSVVDELTAAIRGKAANDNIKQILIYNADSSTTYTMGLARVSIEYVTGDDRFDVFGSYAEFFDKETADLINKMFFGSTLRVIKLSRDMTTNTYRIDYFEGVHAKTNTNMVLSYISRPFDDEQAARDYYGVINDRDVQLCYQIYDKLNENYYYVADTLVNTDFSALV